jgi:hypothetical protein
MFTNVQGIGSGELSRSFRVREKVLLMHCDLIGYQTQILTREANAPLGEHRRSVSSLVAIDKQ